MSRRLDLRRLKKNIALPNLSVYYKWKNVRKHYKNNKLKKVWTDDFELPDASYSLSDIEDYFKYIIKKMKP